MKNLLTLHFVFHSLWLWGQNLVPNPGFDELVSCPTQHGQLGLAAPWSRATIDGTPDLYNECSSTERIKVPNAGTSYRSYQQQRSGGGYAGFFSYGDLFAPEYIQAPLIEKLLPSKLYYIEFYVSPDIDPAQNWRYSDAVGLAFADSALYLQLGKDDVLPLTPAIENRGTLITDTVGWTRISGCYTARGGEGFAVISNFRTREETLLEVENPNSFPYSNYFYIEDVLVQLFDPLPDTLYLCDGAAEVLYVGFRDATYLWNTGSTDSSIIVDAAGTYAVEAFMGNCALRDTVVAVVPGSDRLFESDTVICSDEPLVLAPSFPGSYLWDDGSTQKEKVAASSGNYTVTVTNDCGEYVFSTDVDVEDCTCELYIPSAFSPNGDGINDFFEVYAACDFEYRINRFEVFDRWGGQAYSGQGTDARWDGTARGKGLPNGVYVWFIEYTVSRNGEAVETRTEKGDVVLLR